MHRSARALTFLFALLQLTLPGALRVIDALNAGKAGVVTAHVEDGRSQSCQAPHTDECVVCQYLSTDATVPPPPFAFVLDECQALPPSTSLQSDSGADAHPLFRSRAPPEAVT